MRWILRVIRRPAVAILCVATVTSVAATGLGRLELRMDGHALAPPGDPAVVFDREVRRRFGIRDPLVVLIESARPEGIYNSETLRRVREISDLLAGMEEIGPEHVTSLATERRDRVYPGTLRWRPFLDPFPDTPRLLEHLRADVEATGILTGTLVSEDGRATAIHVGVPETRDGYDRPALYRRLVDAVAPFETAQDHVKVVGAPVAEALLGVHVLEDLALLMPLSILLMAIILGLRLRRVWGVVLGLAEVGACLLFTFGLMGWLGVPVYLTTAVLPVVLITIGIADEIHVFCHYQLHLEQDPAGETPAVVERTMREMLPPVTLTSVTTGIGFLSFTTSAIDPIRAFGLFAAAGIFYCLLWTLVVTPATLTLVPARWLRAPARPEAGDWTIRAFARLLRRPRSTLAALALLSLVLGSGISALYVQDSWIDGFAPGSRLRRETDDVNEQLHGTHTLLVHLETKGGHGEMPRGDGKEGWLLDPNLLNEIGAFEDYLRAQPGVGGVLGPYDHLSTVAFLWQGRREGTRRIPDEAVTVARVLRFFDVVRGPHRRRAVIHDSLDQALVTVFLKDANYRETRGLVAAVRAYEKRFVSQDVRLALAGDVAVSQAMIAAVVRSQVSSLLAALAGALLTVCVLFGSLRLGLLTLLPVSVSVLWAFGAMGWLGIPLGVATSMFCAVSLGIGVDYAIHFIEGWRRASRAGDPEPAGRALRETGPAILTDVAAIAGSFGLLLLSQVPANARLGLLVAIALTTACFTTLAGLGAWLSWKPAFAERARRPSRP